MYDQLITKTIQSIKKSKRNGVSCYSEILSTYNPEYQSWSGESLNIVEQHLDKVAKTLPKEVLIKEFNYIANCFGCDEIDDWDYDTQAMELEAFVDEVFKAIEEEIPCSQRRFRAVAD